MVRRDFIKGIIAAVACAAIGSKKPLSEEIPNAEGPYATVETKFGTVTYKTHPLFT